MAIAGRQRLSRAAVIVAAVAGAGGGAGMPGGPNQERLPSPPPVFRVTTALVQFDAQVADREGRPVTTLTRDDFEVLQDGATVALKDVTFVARPSPAAALPVHVRDRRPVVGWDVEPLVFLVDDMAMTPDGFNRVRDGLRGFVARGLPPGVEAGILRTGETGRRTTSLTAAPDVLLKRIDGLRYLARSHRPGGLASGSGASAGGGRELERTFVEGTLGSVTSLLADVRRLPGRKVVVLLSEGVAIEMGGGEADATPTGSRLDRLAQLAALAGVTMHCVDVAGVRGAPVSLRVRASLKDGLVTLADRMGGRYLDGGNDLTAALAQLAAMEAGYYLLSYEPPEGTFVNGTLAPFRRITVRVRRRGLDVRARRGFFGNAE